MVCRFANETLNLAYTGSIPVPRACFCKSRQGRSTQASMLELVDNSDLESEARKGVWVRIPLDARHLYGR